MRILFCLALLTLALLPSQLPAQIQPGGAIVISIRGVPVSEQGRIDATYPVSEQGTITMWHIGTIKAAGLQSDTLARKIEAAYREAEIYTSPTILVMADSAQTLTQQMYTVGGKVRVPGQKPWTRNMTLYDGVMAAGGPTEFGAMKRVKLYRNGKAYTYDLTQNAHKQVLIFQRDTIEVPQVNWLGQ